MSVRSPKTLNTVGYAPRLLARLLFAEYFRQGEPELLPGGHLIALAQPAALSEYLLTGWFLRRDRAYTQPAGDDGEDLRLPRSAAPAENARR